MKSEEILILIFAIYLLSGVCSLFPLSSKDDGTDNGVFFFLALCPIINTIYVIYSLIKGI